MPAPLVDLNKDRVMVLRFFSIFVGYFIDILPALIPGFLISGIIHEFVPGRWVERHLGEDGLAPLIYSTIAGTALPICCIGSLPVALSMRQKGARLGSVLAFLVATPATSVTALLVCYALLGMKFTVFIFFSVIIMGLVMGLIGNLIKMDPESHGPSDSCDYDPDILKDPVCGMRVDVSNGLKTDYNGRYYYFCSQHCLDTFRKEPEKYASSGNNSLRERIIIALRFGFVDMLKDIGPEIILGLVLAALVSSVYPVGRFVGAYLSGGLGYLFSLVIGIMMYICSTASVPLVSALLSQGLNTGAGMVLLIVGPLTSWSTILVVRKSFGTKVLSYYLVLISIMSLCAGYLFSLI